MKRVLKITGWTLLIIVFFAIGFGTYQYKTNPMIKAMIEHDESKLSYFPSKELRYLEEYNYTENMIVVDSTTTIYTYEFNPKSTPKYNVFFVHGGGGNATHTLPLLKTLINDGAYIYAAEWRGYGKSTGMPNYKGVLNDTEASFKDFYSKHKNDSIKTLVYGMSLGGQLAIKIAKDNPGKVDALVLDGALKSAQAIAYDYSPSFLKGRVKNNPQGFNQDYVGERDIKALVNLPKLIIHSKNDKEVLLYHGKDLFNQAQEPKEFWETDTKHIMTLADYPKEAIEKIKGIIR